jgi:hypothetical protein
MLAMSLLLGCFEPATTAASMAICRPEAIDDAPARWPERSGGWRRRDFLGFREEWPKARGRKSRRRRCGSGDRGAAVLRPDQANERPRGPRTQQHPREKWWRTSVHLHKKHGIPGAEKETLAHGKDALEPINSAMLNSHSQLSYVGSGMQASFSVQQSAARSVKLTIRLPPDMQASETIDQLQPFRVTPIIGTDTDASEVPRSYGGVTNAHIPSQAVQPTTAEPTAANITRQVSDGTPISDSPSVA